MGVREIGDTSAVGDTSAKVQGEDSVIGNEKISWKGQRLGCSGQPYREIKKPLRYLD